MVSMLIASVNWGLAKVTDPLSVRENPDCCAGSSRKDSRGVLT